ncbi:MAG: hypothetical protein EBT49_03820 [Betaproteobacteria bacterium]|nr:hypothetical protein [Betaproteobacteria bacterium]
MIVMQLVCPAAWLAPGRQMPWRAVLVHARKIRLNHQPDFGAQPTCRAPKVVQQGFICELFQISFMLL